MYENNRQIKKKIAGKPKDKNDSIRLPSRYEKYSIAKQHLREGSGSKVFLIRDDNKETAELSRQCSNTLTTRYYGGQANGTYIIEGEFNAQEIVQLNNPKHSNDRVYDVNGISPTLNTMQGGNRQPFILQTPHGHNKGGEKEIAPTLTVNSYEHNNHVVDGYKIRRLTPVECLRLQAFPDDWCDFGIGGVPISNSQKYKMAGNAVTVNVVRDIMKILLANE